MELTDFRCQSRLRVRWAEVDMQRIVFNAHYLMYMDTAMTEYWRGLALPYEDSMQQLGGEMYVKKATLEYASSAREGDSLTVGMRCARVGNSSAHFEAGIFRSEQLLVSGELIYVFADPTIRRPVPIPPTLRQLLADFEAGSDIAQLQVGSWNQLKAGASALREAVFVREQGIDPTLEHDGQDDGALHALVTNRLGHPVATGRLLVHAPGVARIGRMAVHWSLRGSRLGQQVLDALMEAVSERGDRSVVLHAQTSAQGFYERAGFKVCGERYEEAGLPHVTMEQAIA